MSWKIWKKKEERAYEEWKKAYEKGVNQKNWEKAVEHFRKAAELFSTSRNPEMQKEAKKAAALAQLYFALLNPNADAFAACSKAMELLEEDVLKIPYEASAKDIAIETKLLASEARLEVMRKNANTSEKLINLAKEYESLGKEFLKLQRDFVINDLFNLKINGFLRGQKLLGISRFLLGKAEEYYRPAKAVEYYSEALGYFKAAAIEGFNEVNERLKKTSMVAKCWFCGREVQGEDIHFVYLQATFTPFLEEKYGKEIPPTSLNGAVIACKVCHGAMSELSHSIAKMYYDRAVKMIQTAVSQLQSQIDALWNQIRLIKKSMFLKGAY